jgi:hypothetical protein
MSNDYKLVIAKDRSDIEAIRNIWEKFQWHPHGDIDFFINLLNERPKIIRPNVITVYKGSEPKALLVCRLEIAKINCSIGYKTIARPEARLLTLMYGGLLGDVNEEIAKLLLQRLWDSLKKNEADAVYVNFIPKESELFKVVQKVILLPCRDFFPEEEVHWKMTSESINDFMSGQKNISRRKRYARSLIEKYGRELTVRHYFKEEDVEILCNDAEKIAAKTYHRGLGVGFYNDHEHKSRVLLAANHNRLLAFVLYLGEMPISFYIGSLYGKTYYLAFTGYDPEFRKYEPGTILFQKILEVVRDKGVDELDFGFGDALYKKRYCDLSWKEASFYLWAPHWRGIAINAVRTPILGAGILARGIIRGTGLEQKLKTYWRDKLRP